MIGTLSLHDMKTILLRYVTYNQWANDRLLSFVSENFKPEQLEQSIVSSFPSVRTTLLHLWGAECIWLMRLKGESPTTWKWMEFSGSFQELYGEIIENDKAWIDFIETSGDAFLQTQFRYKSLDGTEYHNMVAEAVLHCMNHSTFHRGQLITLFRQLGFKKLFSTDLIAFSRD